MYLQHLAEFANIGRSRPIWIPVKQVPKTDNYLSIFTENPEGVVVQRYTVITAVADVQRSVA